MSATITLLLILLQPVQDGSTDQEKPPGQEPKESEPWWKSYGLPLTLRAEYLAETEAGNFLDVSTFRGGVDFAFGIPLSDEFILTTQISVERSVYDFDGISTIFAGIRDDDIEALDEIQVSEGLLIRPSETWFVFLRVTASLARESGANSSDSIRGGVVLGARHSFSKKFSAQVGVGVFARYEGSPRAIPIVGFTWRPSEEWTISVASPITGVTFRASDSVSIFARANFSFREYRLDQDGILHEAVLQDDIIAVEVGIRWKIIKKIKLTVGVGAPIRRTLRIEDSSENTLFDEDADVAPYVGIRLRFTLS